MLYDDKNLNTKAHKNNHKSIKDEIINDNLICMVNQN